MMRLLVVLIALAGSGACQSPKVVDRLGDVHEIRLESVTITSGSGSSGSSRSVETLIERVIAVRGNGVELEFDLPEQTSAEDRARAWQFPVRVLRSHNSPLELLNAPELEARIAAWLQKGGIARAACGRWIFTWTAVKIECDPQSVLQMLEPFDLRPSELREGAMYRQAGALEPAPLQIGSSDETLIASMKADPDTIRRQRAEQDVIVAQIMGQTPLTLEAALEMRAAERISGTIVTTFETDGVGRIMRRKQVSDIETLDGNGSAEHSNTVVTVERRPLAR